MRAVLGVIGAFIAMSLLVFALSIAPWLLFGVDAVLEPGRYDSTMTFNAYAVLTGIAGALFAGWTCAVIGRSKTAVVVLAFLCFAGGMVNAYGQHQRPEPGPRAAGVSVIQAVSNRKEAAWFTLLMPCVGVVGVMIGGRAGLNRTRTPS
jgi:hypothetical protein